MKTSKHHPRVDEFIGKAKKWQPEMLELRRIVLECELKEELKWGVPCYTYQNKNIVLIHGFKDYCALLFHKGALLKDDHSVLVQQTDNVQAARQIRFKNVSDIIEIEAVLKEYILEAVEVERSGQKVERKKMDDYVLPAELENKFIEMPDLKTAFYALTPGRQRAYLLYFSQAKQAKTRLSRIEKYVPYIFDGKGLND